MTYTMSEKRKKTDKEKIKVSRDTVILCWNLKYLDNLKWEEIEARTGLTRQRWNVLFKREKLPILPIDIRRVE